MSWDWNFAFEIFPSLLKVMVVALGITIASYMVALVFGLFLTYGRRVTFKPISYFVYGFIEFVRSTPLLVQLFFVFYVLPEIGISLNKYVAGILTLGIHYSTYVSEVYRSGIEAIPKGQWEASRALNFSKTQTWFKIILPQAIPPVYPMLGNYLIVMIKETPILSAIGVVEMLQQAKLIGSEHFVYLEPFTIVGFLFLLLSYPSALLIRKLEKRTEQRLLGKERKGEQVEFSS